MVRLILQGLLLLAAVLSLAGGALALLGHARWGGAWWYVASGPDYRLKCGQEALYRGNLERAERVALRLDAEGDVDRGHLLRGEILLREGRLAEALKELNAIRPDNEKVRFEAAVNFGLGLLSLNRLAEAEQLLLYVVAHDPDHLEAHRGLAMLYFDQGAKGLAVQHTREWVRLAPADGLAYRFLGSIYSDFGDSNSWAITAFRNALQCGLSPELAGQVKLELAEILVRQTSYAEAMQVLDELTPEQAGSQTAVEVRAECSYYLVPVSALKPLVERGLADYPDSVPLLRLRATMYHNENKPDAAAGLLERALKLNRYDHASRFLLAQVYEALKRPSEAREQRRLSEETREILDEMSKLSVEAMNKPWDAAARIRLAELCDKLDKPAEAALWRKAAALCPPAPVRPGKPEQTK